MRRGICLVLVVLLLGICGCAKPVEELTVAWSPEPQIAYTLVHRALGTLVGGTDAGLTLSASHTQNQLWLFEKNADGMLIIQNEAEGSYLSVEEDGTVTLCAQRDAAARWVVEQTQVGSCRISLEKTGKYLHFADGSIALGDRADAWELRALTMRLNVYYDAAFADMYAEKGIYVVDALEKILTENSDGADGWRGAETFFREELHVRLDLHITDTAYKSYPYTSGCLYQDDPTAPCHNCAGTVIDGYGPIEYCQNGYHHKDADHIIESTPKSDAKFNLLLTGHAATCARDEGNDGKLEHVENKSDIFGRAEGIGKGNRCAVFLGAFTDVLNYNQIKHSAVHEICHLLGAYHHTAEANTCLHGLGSLTDEGPTSADACRELPVCNDCLARMNFIKTEILFGHVD